MQSHYKSLFINVDNPGEVDRLKQKQKSDELKLIAARQNDATIQKQWETIRQLTKRNQELEKALGEFPRKVEAQAREIKNLREQLKQTPRLFPSSAKINKAVQTDSDEAESKSEVTVNPVVLQLIS